MWNFPLFQYHLQFAEQFSCGKSQCLTFFQLPGMIRYGDLHWKFILTIDVDSWHHHICYLTLKIFSDLYIIYQNRDRGKAFCQNSRSVHDSLFQYSHFLYCFFSIFCFCVCLFFAFWNREITNSELDNSSHGICEIHN